MPTKHARHTHDAPRFWSIFQTVSSNRAKFWGDVPLAKKPFQTKFQPNRSTTSTAIPIWNSAANLQTFVVFSKRGFTRQMTSDWAEILCGLFTPPQFPPYKILLKTHEPISLCLREVPPQMSQERARRAHDPPPILKHLPNRMYGGRSRPVPQPARGDPLWPQEQLEQFAGSWQVRDQDPLAQPSEPILLLRLRIHFADSPCLHSFVGQWLPGARRMPRDVWRSFGRLTLPPAEPFQGWAGR